MPSLSFETLTPLAAVPRASTSSAPPNAPSLSASTNTTQPDKAPPLHSGSSTEGSSLAHTVTMPWRLMASLRAICTARNRPLAPLVRRLLRMNCRMLGAAKPASTATIASTTMSSINVKPPCRDLLMRPI
jgi:hypothetical protein